MKYNMKTLGPKTAKLVATLYDEGKTLFSVNDAARILGDPTAIVSNLLGKAQARGVVTRLRRGTYILVPSAMGSETLYAGDPLLVADRLMEDRPHYLSHGTAMAVHGMTTQPRIVVIVSCVDPPARSIVAQGAEIRVTSIPESEIFGTKRHWLDSGVSVTVSDIERTVVDCLRRPDLCGGYIEVDRGSWMKRDDIDVDRLVEYAVRLGIGAVCARLGYLLDSCSLGTDVHREALRRHLRTTYNLLDPSMPAEGRYMARWKLRLNVGQDEIEATRST
jgi:predicted transcriptional regulator of viral defense system